MPKINDPYSRPIHATREGAMLQGEFYGQRATDKRLSHAAGPVAASQVRALPSVVPGYRCDEVKPKRTRKRTDNAATSETAVVTSEDTTPNPDATSPSEPVSDQKQLTEDELFG